MPLAPSLSIPPTITRRNGDGVHVVQAANRGHDGARGYPGLVAGAAAAPQASQRITTGSGQRPGRIDSRGTRADGWTDPPGVTLRDPRGSSIQEDPRLELRRGAAVAPAPNLGVN